MYDQKTTLEQFLDAAAAKQPTPGGGSITALVGALSASMGEMVLNYSVGKKDLQAYVGELKPALEEFTRARHLMMSLMIEDQLAYETFTAISKLPADAPDRVGKYNAALLACIRVPQAMGATGVAILQLCDRMINFVNPHLLSDLAVCADLAMAAVRCASYNVRINLQGVKESKDRTQIESTISQLLTHGATTIQRVAPRIWERVAQQT